LRCSLLDRDHELDVLRAALDGVRARGDAVLLRGEPGTGKSVLIGWAQREAVARGFTVLKTTGVQAETGMPFAGLQQLLRPVAGRVIALPGTQHDALRSAFGLDAGAPDLYLVALATLSLLGEAAAAGPLLLVADDAHWLDRSTADVLAFVARRLEADPIILLAAAREGYATALDDTPVRELRLRRLGDDDAQRLLDARAPGLEPEVRDRVLAEASGNPLALVELPLAWQAVTADTDADAVPDELPLTARLERAFAGRLAGLPTATSTLLLLAALDDGHTLAETLDAASEILGARPALAALAPAEAAGLVELDARGLRFRHPLVRSAVRQSATTVARTRAHAALAHALGAADPHRSAWHRAAATLEPDDEVATALADAAESARRRGAVPVAISALKRSATLTVDAASRAERLIAAAELEHQLGRRNAASRLLDQVDGRRLDAGRRGRLTWLRDHMHETRGRLTIAQLLALADGMLEARAPGVALDATLAAAHRAHWFDAAQADRDAIGATARRLPFGDEEPRLLAAFTLADPIAHGATVIERLAAASPAGYADPEDLRLLGIALLVIPEYELAGAFLAASVEGLREQGRLAVLARALGSQAYAALFRGDFALAGQAADEGVRLTRETRQPRWECSCLTFLAHLDGISGDPERAEARLAEAERLLRAPRSTPALQHFQLARGATSLAAGAPEVAFDQLARVFDPNDITYNPLVGAPGLVDLADAAVAADRVEAARAIARHAAPVILRTGSPSARRALEHARAVLAEPADAETAFAAALAHDAPDAAWDRARLRLAHGLWLRRRRRVADARASLRIALDGFDALGAQPWADRAGQELRATGERTRRRLPETRDALTPQELHIARLAAEGLTNREIGKRLFLSHRTVGSHLYKIFPKLGISSRGELARAVLDADHGAQPRLSP
jgi:DNA-binding CsgD family transcriptional regulator